MALTLAEIRQHLRDMDHEDGSDRAQRVYDQIANDANMALHSAGDWSFDRTPHRMVFPAVKSDGTVAVNVDATAWAGTGTAFADADVGKHIRIGSEDTQYLISAVTDTENLTGEAYRGDADASGESYQITQDRLALPARFRAYDAPRLAGCNWMLDQKITLDQLLELRMFGQAVSTPHSCAVGHYTSSAIGGAPAPYLWVYPSPLEKTIIEMVMYQHPFEMTDATHGISAPQAAEIAYKAYLRGFLYEVQGYMDKASAALMAADEFSRRKLREYAHKRDLGTREMWTPGGNKGRRFHNRGPASLASGEPVHI